MPSQRVLSQISTYVGLEPEDLLRAPTEFNRIFCGAKADLPSVGAFPELIALLKLVRQTPSALKRFHGVYDRYHNSSIHRGKILHSITYIFERDGMGQHVTVEHFPTPGIPSKTAYSFVYKGFCLALADRIYMIDFEAKQQNEITFSILTPQHRSPFRFLYGLVSGVASSSFRQPFATRMMLVRRSERTLDKGVVRQAGLLAPTESQLLPEVTEYLLSTSSAMVTGGQE